MYKTVRHGENSLQYTILPQTEEVLNNSGIKGKGRDYSPSIHVRRAKTRSKTSYAIIVAFGIVITMIIAAVPICVMNGVLSARTLLHLREGKGSSPLTPVARELVKVRRKELKNDFKTPTDAPTTATSSTTSAPLSAAPRSPVQPAAAAAPTARALPTPPWTMPALRSWKSSTASSKTTQPNTEDSPFIGTPSGSIQLLDHYISLTPWDNEDFMHPTEKPDLSTLPGLEYFGHAKAESIPPGVPTEKVVTQIKKVGDFLVATRTTVVPVYDSEHQPSAPPTLTASPVPSQSSSLQDLKETLLSVDDDDEFKESLEVDEVFSLPPLRPAPPRAPLDAGWYGARWPFVDTSSYFQWTGYTPGDNLLLPLLVGATSSVALVLLLALAVRRRRRSRPATTHIRKLTAELQPDDNTNLLGEGGDEPDAEE